MSHLALYRRFRPDTFDKMVRQEHVVRILKNQIKNGSIGHAYLFTGPRGTGKTTVARIFSRAINCSDPVDGSPCGKCASCLALGKGSLDITEIDAASNNGVDQMRDLREKVQYPPVSGRYKVYIIDEVHMLTDSAFNALLKTLEEPPAHAVFILATTEPQKVPATILSRCMRLDFKLIPEEDLEVHLSRILDEIGKPYEREAVAAIARAGAGSDRDMLSIAEMCIAYGDKLTYEGVTAVLGAADFFETCALVSALLCSDSASALERAENILSEGKAAGVLCKDILSLLNQVTVAKTCPTAERLLSLPKALFAEVKKVADGADGRAILRATEIFAKTETELRYASSPRIALETAIMRVSMPEQDYDLDALLVRIDALEKKLAALTEGVPIAAQQPASPAPEPQRSAREDDFDFPPDEEPIFDEAYFSDDPPQPVQKPPQPVQKPPQPMQKPPQSVQKPPQPQKIETAPSTEAAPPKAEPVRREEQTPSEEGWDAQKVFGMFVRELRRRRERGALFAMCYDLEADRERDTLLLITDSPTILNSLKRPENAEVMREIFLSLGVPNFEVRLKGAGIAADPYSQLKKDFSEYPIEKK